MRNKSVSQELFEKEFVLDGRYRPKAIELKNKFNRKRSKRDLRKLMKEY